MLAISTDLFDQQLVNWFALHGGPWSGTASELLVAMRSGAENWHDSQPDSPRALYSHIETHRQALLALGVDASLHRRHPRMISLRSIHGQRQDQRKDREEEQFASTRTDMSVTSVDSEHFYPSRDDGFAFQDSGEALIAIAEIRMQIREQALALEPAIELVVGRAPEIARSCGVAVGLLQQGNLVFLSRTGVAAIMGNSISRQTYFNAVSGQRGRCNCAMPRTIRWSGLPAGVRVLGLSSSFPYFSIRKSRGQSNSFLESAALSRSVT